MKFSTSLSILFLFYLSGYTQTIEKFSIDSGGAYSAAGNLQVIYTIGEVNVHEANAGNTQLSEGFINASLTIKISPRLFLQGPSLNPETAGLMNDNLRTLGYLPTTSPYPDTATCNASVFSITGNNAIVDWVWIELRETNNNSQIRNARSALLQRDGDVVDVDGVSNLQMTASPQHYYVVVNHRNHLGAMTNTTVALNNTQTIVDFTDSGLATYGSNAQVQLPNGTMALWAGDSNALNRIRLLGADNSATAIKDHVLGDTNNGFGSITYSSAGYSNTDLDLNGNTKFVGTNNDTNVIRDNVLSHPSNGFGSPTYTIIETVPEDN